MKKIFILFALVMLSSCNSTLDKKFSEETFQEDFTVLRSELDSSDARLLVGNILRLTFLQEDLSQMTYRQILEDGKEWREMNNISDDH
jgi:hypothetical protein